MTWLFNKLLVNSLRNFVTFKIALFTLCKYFCMCSNLWHLTCICTPSFAKNSRLGLQNPCWWYNFIFEWELLHQSCKELFSSTTLSLTTPDLLLNNNCPITTHALVLRTRYKTDVNNCKISINIDFIWVLVCLSRDEVIGRHAYNNRKQSSSCIRQVIISFSISVKYVFISPFHFQSVFW